MKNNPANWAVCALLFFAACSRPANYIPEGATQVFDLRTGKELSARKAGLADGFYEGQSFAYGEDVDGWESFYNKRHPRSLVGRDADGGGSSTLWVLPAGVLNHPSDNGRFDHTGQRIVPNILIAQ